MEPRLWILIQAFAHLLPPGDISSSEGDCPIHIAARNNHVEALEQIITEGADVNERRRLV